MTMLDALDARGDRLSDRTRHIRVYGYIRAPIVGGFSRGAKLRFSVLGRSIGLRGELTPPPAISLI